MRSLTTETEHQPSLNSDRFASIARGVVFCPAVVAWPLPGPLAGRELAIEMSYRIAPARAAAQLAARASDLYNTPLCLN